jgi:outer membrane protein OmpA-like peptidoglycan-associated protein/tetratricopeptide (TPR) repeat protein
MKNLIASIALAIITISTFAQSTVSIDEKTDTFIEKGNFYFDNGDFKKAIVYYNMSYDNDPTNYYSVLRKAEAFIEMELFDQAEECYRIIFNSNAKASNKYRLEFAFLLLKNKNISGFEKYMKQYQDIVFSDINDYATSTDVRAKMYYDSLVLIVENESFVNTIESEISPYVYKDQFLFSSNRKRLDGTKGNSNYNIYTAKYTKSGKLGKLNKYNSSLNTRANETGIVISDRARRIYITKNDPGFINLSTEEANIPNDINYKLSPAAFPIEGTTAYGQAAFNSDGTKMYFASKSISGSGGLDLFVSEFVGGKWGTPKNLGASINSTKDDMYPFVVNDSILYFSSEGHGSMGGFDLFMVSLNQANAKPVNLGPKVNTKYDEYGLSFTESGLTGYFASNRTGGMGSDDIYRLHMFTLKIKYPAYQFKSRPSLETDKINLYLSDGTDYNIASDDNSGFNFIFQPEQPYNLVIQHENPLAEGVIDNDKLSDAQRLKQFLSPKPFERTEIELEPGMRYQFTAGMKPISSDFKDELNAMSQEYQNANSTIDLTALAKELLLTEGEIYTIRFEKDEDRTGGRLDENSILKVNDSEVDVARRSFFIVLPLDLEVNFNIQTDLNHFKETFKPKKVGKVTVDTETVNKKPVVQEWEGFPIAVNAETLQETSKTIKAKELIIIPGTTYMLTLIKSFPDTEEKVELFIPLTKGVKYNLGTEVESEDEFNQALSQMSSGSADDEELIDISILSKALDIDKDDDIVFTLMPAKQFGGQQGARNVPTTLDVDGRKYYVTIFQKLHVKLKLEEDKKVNIQTDLAYVKENFEASAISLDVDTSSFTANIVEEEKNIITDPVFDVVVVNFDINQFAVRPDAKTIIDSKVVNELNADERLYVTIKGYTDPLGDAAYNEKLSRNRATAVKDYLSSKGVGENRIRTFSFGETESLKGGKNWEELSEAELQQYRKVEIVIYLPK